MSEKLITHTKNVIKSGEKLTGNLRLSKRFIQQGCFKEPVPMIVEKPWHTWAKQRRPHRDTR